MDIRALLGLLALALAILFACSCGRGGDQESVNSDAEHAYLLPDGDERPLPPYQDVLTSSEKAKLEAMDPLLSSVYTRRWRASRVTPGLEERLLHQFRRDLAAAPSSMAAILESGRLETRWGPLWEELPQALDFTRQFTAHKLVTGGKLEQDDLDALESQLGKLDDSTSRDLFANGYVPGDRPTAPTPLVCEWDASTGVWFEWAVPSPFRNREPQDFVAPGIDSLVRGNDGDGGFGARMPPPEAVLSGAARAKLDSMDAELRRAFQRH